MDNAIARGSLSTSSWNQACIWMGKLGLCLGFLLPFCAHYHLYAFVLVRVVQGFFFGFRSVFDAYNMTAKWIPPDERSKFISSYVGITAGVAISYSVSAVLINWFGWESVFYVTSALGIVWYTNIELFPPADQ